VNICGVWPGHQCLAAVIANDDGTLRPPITVRATPDNAGHLFDYLVTAGIDTLILAEHSDSLISQALARPLRIRLVPNDLLEGIRVATALHRRPPRYTAILLARWPHTSARAYLRDPRQAPPQKTQLPLF